MSTFRKVFDFYRLTAPLRKKFGWFAGLRLAIRLRRNYTLPRGTPYTVKVPGLRHPITLRAGSADQNVFQQIFVWEELAFDVAAAPTTIIDAGAHIGLSAIYLAARFPEAGIVCLEIEQSNFEMLLRNTAPCPQISPRRCGLWRERTSLCITDPRAESWAFTVTETARKADRTVPAAGVQDVLTELGWPEVDLLKIDVEGAEVEVFASAPGWIDRVRTIAVELHDWMRPGCTDALLQALGAEFRCSQSGEYRVCTRHPSPLSYSSKR